MTTDLRTEDNPKFHPLANIVPLMSDEEFAKLVKDIDENGLADPIIMLDGKILDGRNRWAACQQLGIAHREKKFEDLSTGSDDPATFVWSHNIVRRHLNPGQIAMAAEKLEALGKGSNQYKIRVGGEEVSAETSDRPLTREEIVKKTGASRASIAKAKNVRQKGAPGLAEAVESGKVALNAADKISHLPVPEQQEIMETVPPEEIGAEATRREQKREKKTPVRKLPAPQVTMRDHMTGHNAGVRDVQLINKYWADHAELITELDEGSLRSFIKDLEESRRAASQLLGLLAEKLIPEWPLEGKQPSLLSTALNKIDLAKGEAGEKE